MDVSIKRRIYWSFTLLVSLFVINGILTIITLNNNKKLSENISSIIDPSLSSIEDFKDMLVASKMYSTNWVFLRSNQEDKDALKRLHNIDYPRLKVKLNHLSAEWNNKKMADSLNKIFTWFDQVLVVEKGIMSSLQKFDDYDDPAVKLEAERLVEEELLPVTDYLMNGLLGIVSYEVTIRNQKNKDLEESSMRLRLLISVLAITIILIGIFLSLYMTRKIINPINKIRHIVNDLGKGIIRPVNHKSDRDEIGDMVHSVNNLSEKLQATATFATAVGDRNFDSYFEPLSSEDTLGKALVTMRNNLKTSDESLNEAQHIAKLGSWEWDIITNKVFWSDEVYNIFDIDPTRFNPSYEEYLNFIHPEDKEYAGSIITKCLEDHQPFAYECRIISEKKVAKITFAEGKISKNDRGEIIRLTGIVQDITERKKAEKKLEDVNRELSMLFNSIDEVFFSVDLVNYKVIQISTTCEKLYGYKPADFMANYLLWVQIVHPDDKHLIENEDAMMQRGEQISNEYRIIRTDNIIRWVETNITPTLNSKGKLIRVDGVTRDITERKNAEEALRGSEKHLRQIIDLVPHFIFAKDANGNYSLANEAVARAYGCTVEDLIGKNDADFNTNKEETEHFMRADLEVINSGIAKYNIEETSTDFAGNSRILSTTKIPYTSPGVNIPGLLGVSVDISERKKAETVLRESQKQLSIATQIAKLGYWEFDVKEGLFTFNDQFYSIFKTTAEKVGGYTMSGERFIELFVYPDDRVTVYVEGTNAITSKNPHSSHQFEYRGLYANGEMGHMVNCYFIVKDDQGRTIKTFGANQDITERKKAEVALLESREQIQTIYDAVLDAVIIIDEEGKIVKWDSKSELLFGWKQEEVLGTPLTETIIPHQHREAHARAMKHFLKTGEGPVLGKTIEVRALNKSNDEFDVSLSISPSFINGKYQFIGFIRDITSRKKAEAELHKSEAFLEMKNKELEIKNRELEQFAYVASHDLQEPLRTTSSFADLLQNQYSDKLDEKANKYLGFIKHSTDRMKVLIKDLLDYSRIGRQKELEQVDCNVLLSEVLEDLNKLITDENAIIQAHPLPVISGYPTEIQQLFQNLIMNAIKFRKKTATPQIKISAQLVKANWQFSFNDNGIGIEEKHNERIFIIFQRLHTRGEYKGSGIGLSHCKKIVELHGGKIWVNSTPGEGSTFIFTLPAANAGLTYSKTNVPGMYIDIHENLKNGSQTKFQNAN